MSVHERLDLPADALKQLLTSVESESASGSVTFEGDVAGSMFFDSGRIYFAVLDGHPLTVDELTAAGIDQTMWQRAGEQPRARGQFAEELMALGCAKDAIERFILERISTCVKAIGEANRVTMVRGTGRHGFGSIVSFDAGRFLPPVPSTSIQYTDEILVSLSRTDRRHLTLDGEIWNALITLIPPMRFAEVSKALGTTAAGDMLRALEGAGIVTLVSPPQAPNEPTNGTTDEPTNQQVSSEPAVSVPGPADEPEPPITPNPFAWSDTEEEYEEYVPERVGRQAYAAMASMRASRAEPPPHERAHALRRLIEAVRGL